MKTDPMFLRFINKETSVVDLLSSFSKSPDETTSGAARSLLNEPPDLEDFRLELEGAIRDLAADGAGDEFKAFVNHYMEPSLVEELSTEKTKLGENRSQTAYVRDPESPWVQGYVCYNVVLYVKAFGLNDLKICKVCEKLFAHKGKYALYCSDPCKKKKGSIKP